MYDDGPLFRHHYLGGDRHRRLADQGRTTAAASQGVSDDLGDRGAWPGVRPGFVGHVFTLTGTVAATLTGLFFVAFSLRVRDLQLSVVIRTRAAYLLELLLVIVVYSAFVLMPGQSRAAVAAEILIVSMVSVAYLVWCLPRLARLAVFSVDLVILWLVAGT